MGSVHLLCAHINKQTKHDTKVNEGEGERERKEKNEKSVNITSLSQYQQQTVNCRLQQKKQENSDGWDLTCASLGSDIQ